MELSKHHDNKSWDDSDLNNMPADPKLHAFKAVECFFYSPELAQHIYQHGCKKTSNIILFKMLHSTQALFIEGPVCV